MNKEINFVKVCARKMLLKGSDINEVMKETQLRLKDIKRLQKELAKEF